MSKEPSNLLQELDKETILQWAPELSLHLNSSHDIQLQRDGQTFEVGNSGLKMLEIFTQPTRFADAVAKLQNQVSGVQEWMDLVSTITELWKAGVLLDLRRVKPQKHLTKYKEMLTVLPRSII